LKITERILNKSKNLSGLIISNPNILVD